MDEKGKFLRIICARCGRGHIIYGKASTRVKCVKCNMLLVKTGGGKIRIRAVVKKVFRF